MEDRARNWVSKVLPPVLLLASVTCGQEIPVTSSSSTSLRLVNGANNYGRLEIFHDGVWGTICDDNFDDFDAMVACRELDLDSATVSYYTNAYFGQGFGNIWLDELACRGYERALVNCTHNGFANNDCSHSEDVGISCGITAVDPVSTESGGFAFSGVGSWIGFVLLILLVVISVTIWRRRRVYMYNRSQRATAITTTTTAIVQPTAVQSNPSNTGIRTYYHSAQQAGGTPAPPAAPVPADQGAYPRQQQPYPQQPYPQQPYPQQPYTQGPNAGSAYPPPPTGTAPGSTAYPAQPYPPLAQQPGFGAAVPYPPPSQPSSDPYPIYPPQVTGTAPPEDLPPPPSYNDIVKQ